MHRKKSLALLSAAGMLFISPATCLEEAKKVFLPPDTQPGTCFEFQLNETLIEIPCSVFE